MTYFRELPNIEYQSPLSTRSSSEEYVAVKNLFRRVKLRDDLHNVLTIFDKYQIPQGYRPEIVAEEFYGDQELDWVVCMTAGIINVRQDWPLSDKELWYYAENKYGDTLNNNRHYETTEVKDTNGRLILPKGKVVDSNFTIPKPGVPTATINPVVGISNYEYEARKNMEKSSIYLLKPRYFQQMVDDFRRASLYKKSDSFITKRLKETG